MYEQKFKIRLSSIFLPWALFYPNWPSDNSKGFILFSQHKWTISGFPHIPFHDNIHILVRKEKTWVKKW